MAEILSEVVEREILDIVKNAGEKGILQRDIWGKLKIDSRRGIKIIKRLEKRGLLTREEYIYKGRKTYILKPTSKAFRKVVLPQSLNGVPCFYCPYLYKCGSGEFHPAHCKLLDKWLYKEKAKEAKTVEVSVREG